MVLAFEAFDDVIGGGGGGGVDPVQIDLHAHLPEPSRHAQRAGRAVGQACEIQALVLQSANQFGGSGKRLVLMVNGPVQIEQHRLIGRKIDRHGREV